MADETKTYGSVKRYGVRYGTKLKGKIAKIEAERRASTTCPYCHYDKVKRESAGIWNCLKCKARFTGKAYVPGGNVSIKSTEPLPEAPATIEESEAEEEGDEDGNDEEEDDEDQQDEQEK